MVLDLSDRRLPTIRHWGADLGVLTEEQLRDLVEAARPPLGDSPMDVADQITVVPEHAAAWLGRPGLEGGRAGQDWSTSFRVESIRTRDNGDGQRLLIDSEDLPARLTMSLEIELTPSGLLRLRASLVNQAPVPFAVGAFGWCCRSRGRPSSCSISPADTRWNGFRSGSHSPWASILGNSGWVDPGSTRHTC